MEKKIQIGIMNFFSICKMSARDVGEKNNQVKFTIIIKY